MLVNRKFSMLSRGRTVENSLFGDVEERERESVEWGSEKMEQFAFVN